MSRYTTEQLLACLQHLDHDCFPVEISRITQELIRRGVNPSAACAARHGG